MKKMKFFLGLTASWLLLSWAVGQRTSETAEWLFADHQEVVQTATRTERTVFESFTTVRVLTRREIELSGAKTLQELLERMVAGFEGNEGSIHKFLSVRGAYSASEFNERALYLLDGIPLNDAAVGNFSATSMSTANIERVEIAFGPGSAMYGPNAFAGVVNIITRQETSSPNTLSSGYTERGGYNTFLQWTVGTPQSHWWSVQTSFWRDPGSNRIQNNDTITRSVFIHYRSPSEASQSWRVHYGYIDMDRGSVGLRYGVFPTPNDRWLSRHHYWQVEHASGKEHNRQIARFYGLSGKVSLLRTQPPTFALPTRVPRNFDQTIAGFEVYRQWGDSHAVYLAGGDFRWFRAHSTNHLGGTRTATNLAFFLQGEWHIGRWHPLFGIRYDNHSIYGSQLSPRMGFTYEVSQRDIVRFSVGRAFRAPSFVELYLTNFQLWTPFWDGNKWIPVPYILMGNANLKPERVVSTEVGWKHASANFRWDVAYFSQALRDGITVFLIDHNQPWLRQYNNLSRIDAQGVSMEMGVKLAHHTEFTFGYSSVDYRGAINQDFRPAKDHFVIRLSRWNNQGWSGQIAFVYPSKGQGLSRANGWKGFLTLIYRPDAKNQWTLRVDNLLNVSNELAYRVPGGSRSVWLSYQRDW